MEKIEKKTSLKDVKAAVQGLEGEVRRHLGETESGAAVLIDISQIQQLIQKIETRGAASEDIPPGSDQIICGAASRNGN